jgi:large repetitive protein
MGRRLAKILIVLFLGSLQSLTLMAQTEVGTIETACTFEINYTIHHPTCPQMSDGYIDLDIVNAVGTPEIYWISGTNDSTTFVDVLSAGIYTAQVIDSSQCIDTLTFTLNDPSPVVLDVVTNKSCPGLGNGIITLVQNADAVATYSIDGGMGQTVPVFTDLEPGIYSISAIDTLGCLFEDDIEIVEDETPMFTFAQEAPTCANTNDGSLIVIIETVSNIGNYEYSLDGNSYIPDSLFENLNDGVYEVYVRSDSYCVYTETLAIAGPEEPEFSIQKTDATCPGGDDASFTVILETVSNSENFDYSIDGINYQPDSIFANLESDLYPIYIKNSADCIFEESVFIEEPETPTIDFEINEVTCPGGDDASFIVIIETVSNAEDYLYSVDGNMYQADSIFTNLEAGVYEVYAKDTLGCITSQLMEVEEPETPEISFDIDPVTCPGGDDASFIVIIETVSNTEEYLYSVDGNMYQADSIFTNLEAGVYEVYAKDTVGCIFTELMEVEEPETPEIDFEVNDVTCPGGDDASFIVIIETVSNTEEYLYSVDGNMYQADSIFTNLEAGVYEVYAKDTLGCVFTELMEVEEPETPEISFDIDPVTCSGGDDASFIVIIETVSNTEEYLYSVDGNVYQADSIFTNLEAGVYEVYAKDTVGCIFTQLMEVEEPELPEINFEVNAVSCNGGSDASLIVIIETVSTAEEYLYSLDGDNYQPDSTFTGLPAGVYTVYIQNENNCEYSEIVEVQEPDETTLTLTKNDISCPGENDGIITVLAEGPDTTYEYSLDGIVFQNSNIFENLSEGSYEVIVKNANNCIVSENTFIIEPDLPNYDLELQDISCSGSNDGSITVNLISGIEPFEYSLDGTTYQSSNIFDNLSVGSYTLYLMDDSGCIFTAMTSLEEPPPINGLSSSQNETCDYANGWIAVEVEGGTFPYDFNWSNQETSPSISDLSAGIYRVSITDGNYCLLIDTIVIENEPAPNIEVELHSLNCFDSEDGWVSLDIESESAPFHYVWSNGSQTEEINDLGAGEYSVTVTDRNNCISSAHFELEEPDEMQINGEAFIAEYFGDLDLEVEGGQPPYDYQWSHGHTGEDLENTPFGLYSVTVTDTNGCEGTADFKIFDPKLPIDGAINVYPTITFDEVNIDIQLPSSKKVSIFLVDELGRLVHTIDRSLIEQQIFTLDLDLLAPAVYFLRIEVGTDVVMKKVVKVME